MRIKKIALAFFGVIIFNSCNPYIKGRFATIDNNVCKKLSGKVVIYAVFVDTKYTKPWTSFDILSTLDSIKIAAKWIEKKASEYSNSTTIEVVYHQSKKTIPISKNLPQKSLYKTLITTSPLFGIKRTDNWANSIAVEAGKSFSPDTSSITKTKIVIKDRERLIARLRDIYKTENVALMFFINNYFMEDISAVLHSASNDDNAEYGIVSYKTPAVIAHEFLHLFGAMDLYTTPWDKKRQAKKKKEWAMKEFPNEIMAFTHRHIDSLEIGQFTRYLVGWDKTLNEEYRKKLLGRNIYPLKY